MMKVQISLHMPLKKVSGKALPDTDATLPLHTPILAIQVNPDGHLGPSGDRLLVVMELELLKRGTEEITQT